MSPDDPSLAGPVRAATGRIPLSLRPLPGGCVAEVYCVELEGGERIVAKVDAQAGLAVEGFMLDYLARETDLPVPATLFCSDRLLLMDYVPSRGGRSRASEEDAAEALAALHGIGASAYGFERDTVIGALPQPNPWEKDWCAFYRDNRLLAMGQLARKSGRLPEEIFRRLAVFCERIDRFIPAAGRPALLHGDVWAGNLLYGKDRVAAFIDPALYFGEAEVELAYIEMLSTFGPAFFERYNSLRPIDPGYHESRRDIYQLFPLLVHTQICGDPYPAQIAAILTRYA